MLIILLISYVLGACSEHTVESECYDDSKCRWQAGAPTKCQEHGCEQFPIRGYCEEDGICEWKNGKCAAINCRRYTEASCPVEDDCQLFTFTNDNPRCYPKEWTLNKDDRCSLSPTSFNCKLGGSCVWSNKQCVYDGCSKYMQTGQEDCDPDKCFHDGTGPGSYCRRKPYDPINKNCIYFDAGAECNSIPDCMTVGDACKLDACLRINKKETCQTTTDCVFGIPDLFKDWEDVGEGICYHKDHLFSPEDSAFASFPALVQNKIFLLATALLLLALL